jgi:hypothetical protein
MSTSSDLLEQARELPLDERLTLSVQIAEDAAREQAQSLSADERGRIDTVLADRVGGSFEPLPTEDEFMAQVKDRAAEIKAARPNG